MDARLLSQTFDGSDSDVQPNAEHPTQTDSHQTTISVAAVPAGPINTAPVEQHVTPPIVTTTLPEPPVVPQEFDLNTALRELEQAAADIDGVLQQLAALNTLAAANENSAANAARPATEREPVSSEGSASSSLSNEQREFLIDTSALLASIQIVPSDEIQPLLPPRDVEEGGSENPPQEEHYDACCVTVRPLRPLLYFGPVSVAAGEAADIARSLWKSNTNSLAILITAGTAAFLSSIGLTGETTRKNFDETCGTIKRRKLPADWPKLTPGKEKTAIALSLLPAIWGPASEGMQVYFFIDGIPAEYKFDSRVNPVLWSAVSGTLAGGAGLTTILTESAEMYKVIRERLAGHSTPYTNPFSRFVSPVLGGTLGVLKSLQDSIQGYIAIKSIFSIESAYGRVLIGVPSLVNAIPNFCFSGMFSINALDEFFGYVQKRKLEPKKYIALTMSLALAVYLAFLKRALNKSFYQDVTNDFGLDQNKIPEEFYDSLSWAMFVQESMQGTATLYLPMYNLVNRFTNGTSKACHWLYGFFSSACSRRSDSEDRPALDIQHAEAAPLLREEQKEASQNSNTSYGALERTSSRDRLFDSSGQQERPRQAHRKKKERESWCGIM